MRYPELPVSRLAAVLRRALALQWVAALCALAMVGSAMAQSSGGVYEVKSHAIANGGGRASGGVYALDGTTGQHDAGSAQTGAGYEINGGFHRRASSIAGDSIFGNGFE